MDRMNAVLAPCLLLLAAVSQSPAVTVDELPQWNAMFRRTAGWTGADGAATVSLSPGVTLWLFGDTWVGEVVDGRRSRATMINNSLAVQYGRQPPPARAEFFTTRAGASRPTALLVPTDRGFYWPLSGVRTSRGLFLLASHVEKCGAANDAFGFRMLGVDLLRVEGPPERPDRWQVRAQQLPWCRPDRQQSGVFFGVALLRHGPRVYLYGCEEDRTVTPQRKYAVVARVAENQIDQWQAWQFYCGGQWSSDGRNPDRLFGRAANEFSVSYQPRLGRFVAVYTPGGLSAQIEIRTALAPEGPWGDPLVAYTCPEMRRDAKVFCYAAKGHPELSADDELIVTYATNSPDFWYVASHAEYYWPTFIRLKFPASLTNGSALQ